MESSEERLMREKALKRPFLQEDQEEPEMEERDEEDKVQEEERPVEEEPEKLSVEKKEPRRPIEINTEDEEDRIPDKYEEEERPVEEEPEKLSIEEEEEPRRRMKYYKLDILCEALKPELDARWMEKNAVGHGEEKPQKEAKLVGENKDEEEWEPKKSNNSKRQPSTEDSQPDMPEELKDHIQEMGGRSVKFQTERRMFKTDEDHLPVNPVQEILTKEEERMFLEEGTGMEVEVVEPSLQHAHIAIRKWRNGKIYNYVFANKNWINGVQRNALQKGTVVQVWSFRNMDSKLCFAIVRV